MGSFQYKGKVKMSKFEIRLLEALIGIKEELHAIATGGELSSLKVGGNEIAKTVVRKTNSDFRKSTHDNA